MMKIIYSQNFFTNLKSKHLLLDTSFFIDAANFSDEFLDFTTQCNIHDITLVTIDPVKAEFLKGSETNVKYESKLKFITDTIHSILPIPTTILSEYLPRLVKGYGELGKGTSIVDFILCSMLQYYQSGLYLLTKNPKDYPNTVTNLHSYFLLYNTRALQPYLVLENKQPTIGKPTSF